MTEQEQLQSAADALERHASMMRTIMSGPHSASESNRRRLALYLESAKRCVSILDQTRHENNYLRDLNRVLQACSTDKHFYGFEQLADRTVIIQGAFNTDALRHAIISSPLDTQLEFAKDKSNG